MFRLSDPAVGSEAYKGYYLGLNAVTCVVELGKSSNNRLMIITSAKYPLKLKENFKLKIRSVGNVFEVFINDSKNTVLTASDSEFKVGSIGLRVYDALATVDNIEVNSLQPVLH